MVRIARERIDDLFVLASREASGEHPDLAGRYVVLARKIGTRYNIRLLPEYRELYCRACSAYWVEGRTVRTRLRSGRRVRTCLACGRERRTRLHRPVRGAALPPDRGSLPRRSEGAIAFAVGDQPDGDDESEDE